MTHCAFHVQTSTPAQSVFFFCFFFLASFASQFLSARSICQLCRSAAPPCSLPSTSWRLVHLAESVMRRSVKNQTSVSTLPPCDPLLHSHRKFGKQTKKKKKKVGCNLESESRYLLRRCVSFGVGDHCARSSSHVSETCPSPSQTCSFRPSTRYRESRFRVARAASRGG